MCASVHFFLLYRANERKEKEAATLRKILISTLEPLRIGNREIWCHLEENKRKCLCIESEEQQQQQLQFPTVAWIEKKKRKSHFCCNSMWLALFFALCPLSTVYQLFKTTNSHSFAFYSFSTSHLGYTDGIYFSSFIRCICISNRSSAFKVETPLLFFCIFFGICIWNILLVSLEDVFDFSSYLYSMRCIAWCKCIHRLRYRAWLRFVSEEIWIR